MSPLYKAEFVIIGAGSAGCAMAYRLAQAGRKVIVIEYGGSDVGPLIQMPAALSYPMNMSLYDWGYRSEPEPYLGGRRMATPRGKVIGGSSSINGMVYVRGHAKDFDHWAESGADGWGYADVLPYYRRMECWHGNEAAEDQQRAQEMGADVARWRGHDGPLHISRGSRLNPLVNSFIKAGQQAGYPVTADYNGHQQEGFGAMEATIYKGRRWSAANAYLKPALHSGNCQLVRGLAEKIVIADRQAKGVMVNINGESRFIAAEAEVVVAASSINSPKLLMLSGIGAGAQLQQHGISVVKDLPGVGENLQDHLELYVQFAIHQPISLFKYWNWWSKAVIGAQWLFFKRGIGASNQFESCAFIRSGAGVEYPDIQYHFLPIAVRYDGQAAAEGHGFQAHVGPMRSRSRGWVRLRSADPHEAPLIQFNYMAFDQDWEEFRQCIRLTREIASQPAFQPYISGEIQPGAAVQSDAALNDFIREHVESAYHPCGTCKMGSVDDPMAVVDPQTRVIGIDRLRVADSSIFPRITNGNLNGPSIMVGEKASDFLLSRSALPAVNDGPWLHPHWRTRQR